MSSETTGGPLRYVMPDVLSALIAFVGEHRLCGDVDGRLEDDMAWLVCSCGAGLARPAEQQRGHRSGSDSARRQIGELQSKGTAATQ